MKPNCIFILLSALLWLAAGGLKAQVTVGSDDPPERAALLELKTQPANGENVTSTKGGFIMPRVRLLSPLTLQPFIPDSDTDWLNPTEQARLKKVHTGLEVYNLTNDANFKPGIHVWSGERWETATSSIPSIAAANGLAKSNDTVRLGGSLTQTGTITLGANNLTLNATGAGKMAIGTPLTTAPALLEVNATNKGVLLPRTGLTSNTDKNTILNPETGLIVYNTSTNSTLTPGLVAWDGAVWRKMVTEIPKVEGTTVQRLNLQTNTPTTSGGALLNFGTLTIPEDGTYMFVFRLIGATTGTGGATATISNMRTSTYTLTAYAGTGTSNPKGTAVVTLFTYFNGSQHLSNTAVLSAEFTKGNSVTFRLAHNSGNAWTLNGGIDSRADRSTLIWWKM
jgi:hypothetical protein